MPDLLDHVTEKTIVRAWSHDDSCGGLVFSGFGTVKRYAEYHGIPIDDMRDGLEFAGQFRFGAHVFRTPNHDAFADIGL